MSLSIIVLSAALVDFSTECNSPGPGCYGCPRADTCEAVEDDEDLE